MKRIVIFATLFLLLASIAYADLCTDTDGGENYGVLGTAKYAITQKDDFCVISPTADIRQDKSQYLKEYFCKNDQMDFEIIDCVREGFTGCEFGECVGGTAGAKATGNYTPPPRQPTCGDSVVDEGEDCDPMNKICFDDDGNIGLCDASCKCEIKITKEGSKVDSDDTDTTDTDDTTDTTDVEIDTPVEIDTEPKPLPVVTKDEPDEDKRITVTIAEKPKKEAPKGFFARIWAWFAGLFS